MCTEEAFCDSIKRRMEDRLTGRLFSHGEYTEERRGTTLKRINWVLIVLVLIGFVIGIIFHLSRVRVSPAAE